MSKAVVLVDQYKRYQFVFNKHTGTYLLHACIRAGHFDAAMTILETWRRLRVRFSAASGQRLLAAMAEAGNVDMMLSAHSLLLKAAENFDSKDTQQVVMRCLP